MEVSVTSEFSSLCMKAATTEVEDVLHAANEGLLRLSPCMQRRSYQIKAMCACLCHWFSQFTQNGQ